MDTQRMTRKLKRSARTFVLMMSAFGVAPAWSADFADLLQPVPGQARTQLVDAAHAAPRLQARLDALAQAGTLKAVRVVGADDAPVVRGRRFEAAAIAGELVITGELLDALRENRRYDVVSKDDVLPDNTVFVLGHLSWHLEHAAEVAATGAAFDARIRGGMQKARRDGTQFDATQPLKEMIDASLGNEASALIQAWNDTVEAAQAKVGKTLDPMQMGSLLINLRYREPFSKALDASSDGGGLRMLDIGIEQSPSNRRALAEALEQSPVADVE